MPVIAIREPADRAEPGKTVEANQKAVDALPFDSGTWRVDGIPGLYIRCRAKTKSFFIQRRVDGYLTKQTLGPLPMKRAKDAAMKMWGGMKPPAPSTDGAVKLGEAIEQYIAAKPLADKTKHIMEYNTRRYLPHWKARTLEQIGRDRTGVRLLQQRITKEHGRSTSNQVVRMLSAVYRWHRKVNTELPESPMVVAEIHKLDARDWGYSLDELRAWWSASQERAGKQVPVGVKTLGTMKKMWWLAALFLGARKGSIEALKWTDIDLGKKVIRFRVAKGGRGYMVPMSDILSELFTRYQGASDIPPSEKQWVFPSPAIEGKHIVDVKNINDGVGPAHRLRHTFRTTLAELGATPDQARLLMGHALGGDVSRGYISAPLVVESLRPITNAVADRYLKILGPVVD
jgi:integrase